MGECVPYALPALQSSLATLLPCCNTFQMPDASEGQDSQKYLACSGSNTHSQVPPLLLLAL